MCKGTTCIVEKSHVRQFENLTLPEKQQNVIKQWIAAIHDQNAAYTMVVFRMAM